jgi:V8-like Glu-specific endopeptidase
LKDVTTSRKSTSPRTPQPLNWHIGIAVEAMYFFSMEGHTQGLEMLNRTDPPNTFVPFEGSHFLQYLDNRGYPEIWPKIRHVAAVLEGLVREAHLSKLPGSIVTPGLAGSFMTFTPPTAFQRDGDLWLAPVLGPMLLIPRVGGATIPLSGTSRATGDGTIGSGIALDGEHILTAAHVVNGMTIDDDLKRPAVDSSVDDYPHPAGDLHVEAVKAHDTIDVAIVRVSGAKGAQMDAAGGLAWRDPAWSDELTIFGYPTVPTSLGAYLTVQRGEVVNPRITSTAGEAFLFSATARPGNSGGPIVGRDGRLLGIVTHEPNAKAATHPEAKNGQREPDTNQQFDTNNLSGNQPAPEKQGEAPFYAGVPSTVIAQALEEINLGHLVRMENWD